MACILIIDDDDEFRATVAQMLTDAGHTMHSAADDGLTGAQLFRSSPTGLVLTDMMMPHGGLAAIRVLREQFPTLKIIAMSGGGAHRFDYARMLGARATLAKPFTPAQLATAIADTLAAASVCPFLANSFRPCTPTSRHRSGLVVGLPDGCFPRSGECTRPACCFRRPAESSPDGSGGTPEPARGTRALPGPPRASPDLLKLRALPGPPRISPDLFKRPRALPGLRKLRALISGRLNESANHSAN